MAAAVVSTIPDGTEPYGVSSDGTHVWVSNFHEGTVAEIDASTGAVIKTITVGNDPEGVSSDGTHVWVGNGLGDTVTEIDAASGTVVNTIGVGNFPAFVSSDGTHVWATNYEDGTVSEIDAASATVVNTITVGSCPEGVSSDSTHVWVLNACENTVSEIDTASGTVVNTIPVPHGSFNNGMVSSDGMHVWVTDEGGPMDAGGTVTEIDAATGVVVRTITVGAETEGVSSDGTHVWVASYVFGHGEEDGYVSEIDAATGALVNTIPVGLDPLRIASDGTHVWVPNYSEGTVSEIDIAAKSAPTVAVTDNSSGVVMGESFTYTATVTASGITPTGAVTWTVTGPGGATVPCSRTTGPSGSEYVGTYTCVIEDAMVGSYSAKAAYAGDSNYSSGSTTDGSASVATPPPTVMAVPTISGSTTEGQVLTEAHGSWANSPTSYAYQWEDCDGEGNNCSAISGATAQTYTLASADVGDTIRVQETATGSGGPSTPATSAATGVVTALPSTSTPTSLNPGATTSGPQPTTTGPYVVEGPFLTAGPKPKALPTSRQVKAALTAALTVTGKTGTITALLKDSDYVVSFTAPSAGQLTISWYSVPQGAHLTKAGKPELVASASMTFHHAGTSEVKLTLTGTGRHLLGSAKRRKLSDKGTFTPVGGITTSTTQTITVKR